MRAPPAYASDVDVRAWLRERGAEAIEHPGGTLYARIGRVHDPLAALGLGPDVARAGLTHATYGTDGFDVALLPLTERATLRALIGPSAEGLVYRYGACDLSRTWRPLATSYTVWDRFTGTLNAFRRMSCGPSSISPSSMSWTSPSRIRRCSTGTATLSARCSGRGSISLRPRSSTMPATCSNSEHRRDALGGGDPVGCAQPEFRAQRASVITAPGLGSKADQGVCRLAGASHGAVS
jgi:hypothetical protein